MRIGDQTEYGRVAAEINIRPDDPEVADKMRSLVNQGLTWIGQHGGNPSVYRESMRQALDLLQHTFAEFRTVAMSLVGAAYGALGAKPGQVRVTGTTTNMGFALSFYALPDESPEGEILVAKTILGVASGATATGGLTLGLTLHLTPAASRPLWERDGVINADATEVTDDEGTLS